MASYEFIEVNKNESLTTISINRPELRNAIHPPASRELAAAFRAFEEDRSQRVAIITGSGDEAFCAGNDVKFTISAKPEEMALPEEGFGGITSFFARSKPVIAAVNGFAFGGGFEIALACDVIVAAEKARFALPEVKIGLAALAGGIHRLGRQIPYKLATEMLLTGRQLNAEEAKSVGLVSQVCEGDQLMETAISLAAEMIAGSPYSQRVSLEALRAGSGLSLEEALGLDRKYAKAILEYGEYREGINAFIEKRAPKW